MIRNNPWYINKLKLLLSTDLTSDELSDDLETLQKQHEDLMKQIETTQRKLEQLARSYHRAAQTNFFVRYSNFKQIILEAIS